MLSLLLALAALIALYWTFRYGGLAIDGDATRLVLAAEGTYLEGELAPQRAAYHAGYGYPAHLAFLGAVTGLDVRELQLGAGLWLVVLTVVVFVCYRELLGNTVTALLASALLLVQPDFLFYILRGSHEKLTWLCMVLMIWLVARSYRKDNKPFYLVVYVVGFYLVFWAMMSTNAYFGSTFLATLVLSFVIGGALNGWGAGRRTPSHWDWKFIQRFAIMGLACAVIVFVSVTYVYGPALDYYRTLGDILDRLGLLLLGGEPLARPYRSVEAAWRDPIIYLALIIPQFLIMACSFAGWMLLAWRRVRKGPDSASPSLWFLWFMCTGYAIQLCVGIVLDYAGLLGSNLQLRLFPAFTLVATPLAAYVLVEGYRRLGISRRTLVLVLGAFMAYALPACLLKVSNDPAVSNLWIFYSPAERQAHWWADQHLEGTEIWVDTWPHQHDAILFLKGYSWATNNRYRSGSGETASPHVLMSQGTRLQANRVPSYLPSTNGRNLVYENGDVQLFHRRPVTPYQR
jgi:hypothetical protein